MKGEAPGELVQSAQETKPPFTTLSTRPMCLYPAFPQYKGTGDPKDASSFVCARE
jgi:feruloyl esterase